jgi:hypothetical protein
VATSLSGLWSHPLQETCLLLSSSLLPSPHQAPMSLLEGLCLIFVLYPTPSPWAQPVSICRALEVGDFPMSSGSSRSSLPLRTTSSLAFWDYPLDHTSSAILLYQASVQSHEPCSRGHWPLLWSLMVELESKGLGSVLWVPCPHQEKMAA